MTDGVESDARDDVRALARRVLGWAGPGVVNVADRHSKQSVAIAEALTQALFAPADAPLRPASPQRTGTSFEHEITDYIRTELQRRAPTVSWTVERGRPIDRFIQYRHLANVAALVEADASGLLGDALGVDYVVRPDIVVGRRVRPGNEQFLHASLSCKWTIRSDRVQNARHEANVLLQRRRGRAPHIVTVTAEPLPSRLASIARGTGEIDRTYHLALPELRDAVARVGNAKHVRDLEDLMANDRLADLSELPQALLY